VTVIVLGAGIIGCSIAYELARRGARVRVVDPRGTGEGATRASAGTLAPYIEGHSIVLRELGVRSLGMFDRFVEQVSADAGASIEYARTGTLQVGRDAAEATALEALASELGAAGVTHELVDGPGAKRIEPGIAAVAGGLLIPDHGFVAVQPLTQALERAATRLGVAWSAERLTIADAAASADAVVVAAGAWSSDLRTPNPTTNPQPPTHHQPPTTIHQPVRPIRGQLVHLKLDAPPLGRVVWGRSCYAVPWADGSLLVGATVEDVGFDESVTPDAVRSLATAAADLVPAARGARIQEVRVGLRPMTPDGLPAIGRSSTMPGVFYATGHYRTGVLLAPLTSALVADLVLDQRHDPALAAVRPDRLGL
jgi:glycine oxidase